jgi:cardiolipin synthase
LATKPKNPVADHHFLVDGAVVTQIVREFDDDWEFATNRRLEPDLRPPEVAAARERARAIPSGPDQEVDQLVLTLLSAVNAAQRSIRIATPYFLPDEQLVTALELAALRGVSVDIVLPAKNNHFVVAWAAQAHVGPLLKSGCRIWLRPPPFDHSKLMTVDGLWCLIGSANWDTRSLRLNFEMTVEFYDAELAQRIEAAIDDRRGAALTLNDLERRPFIVKLRDAAARLTMPYI